MHTYTCVYVCMCMCASMHAIEPSWHISIHLLYGNLECGLLHSNDTFYHLSLVWSLSTLHTGVRQLFSEYHGRREALQPGNLGYCTYVAFQLPLTPLVADSLRLYGVNGPSYQHTRHTCSYYQVKSSGAVKFVRIEARTLAGVCYIYCIAVVEHQIRWPVLPLLIMDASDEAYAVLAPCFLCFSVGVGHSQHHRVCTHGCGFVGLKGCTLY